MDWILESKDRLETVSPTFCLAPWKQVTLHLHAGLSQSCCHAPPHSISREAIQSEPSALHNTDRKKAVREDLRAGVSHADCNYCWASEKQDAPFSDRHFKSEEFWAAPFFNEVVGSAKNANANPSYLEISFSHVCNLKCSYCSPTTSSKWISELKQHGAYRMADNATHHDLQTLSQIGLLPGDARPFAEAFWKWWPTLSPELRVLRVTGGEPLLHPDVFKLLDMLEQASPKKIHFAINSNMSVPRSLVTKMAEKVSVLLDERKVEDFTLYTSMEAVGKQAEYIRYGLDYELWLSNLDHWLGYHPRFKAVITSTINNLSLTTYRDFLNDVRALREGLEDPNRLQIDVAELRDPVWQSLSILPPHHLDELERVAQEMTIQKDAFFPMEVEKMARLVGWARGESASLSESARTQARKNFYHFFSQHDERRHTRLTEIFPDLTPFWDLCRKAAGATQSQSTPSLSMSQPEQERLEERFS